LPNGPTESNNSRAPLLSKPDRKQPNPQQAWRKGRGRKKTQLPQVKASEGQDGNQQGSEDARSRESPSLVRAAGD